MNKKRQAGRSAARQTPEDREQLAHGSWLAVVRAYHLCEAVLTQRLEVLGVKLAEHEVLINLLLEDRLTQQQIADRCFSARSGISMLVTKLEEKVWVLRQVDEADQRAKRIALTPTGRRIARQCHAVQREVVTLMTDGADDARLHQVFEAMQQAASALRTALD